ncbi:conserved hypothetical protein [Paraburkholderia ribeironis]|uniref:Membrane-associated oxidoreductase n=1 Tax=Paraburkholderia ribeironis TaxID=1247936 RepID=A0A1N7SPH7_9BURK|nr:conserved hypothetical protein [Paraburkholderia ribeironis]
MKVEGLLRLESVHPKTVDLRWLNVRDGVSINNSNLQGIVSLEMASIDGGLLIDNLSTFNEVDASNSRIGGQFAVKNELPIVVQDWRKPVPAAKIPWDCSATRWTGVSRLDLSGTYINEIRVPTAMDLWPKEIDLTGFTFRFFHAMDDRNLPAVPQGVTPAEWFTCWLARASSQRYDPGPYQAVADFLLKTGDADAAREVGIAGKNKERAQACRSVLTPNWFDYVLPCTYLWLSWALVGYGYRLYLSFVWAAIFIGVGTVVFRHTLEGRLAKVPIGFAYSFDMFLPLVKLRDEHYKIDIKSRARYCLYVHKLAGWVLGTFIVAALTGLTK